MKCEHAASAPTGITWDFSLLLLQGAWTFDAPVLGPFPPIYLSGLPVLSGTESMGHQRVKRLSFNSIIYGL